MISERQFAAGHGEFWRQLLPMAEEYLRAWNRQPGRFAAPFRSTLAVETRGLVNELAFRLFAVSRSEMTPVADLSGAAAAACIEASLGQSRAVDEGSRRATDNVSDDEVSEARVLATRLSAFAEKTVVGSVLSFPVFPGCGWLEESVGDFVADRTVFEVKAGDRSFRSLDLRQILIYCALNFSAKTFDIRYVCLVNPRLGVFMRESLDRVCMDAGGRGASDLLGDIVEYMSEPVDPVALDEL